MAYAVFQSDRALPQSADVLTYLPWLPNATKLPAGNSTATVIAQAIEYVDAGAISPRLKTWANKLGVILIPKRNVATPEGGLRDNWLERHSRAMMLIGRALTGWPVDVGSSLHGGISYVQLPDPSMGTVSFNWDDFTWGLGTLEDILKPYTGEEEMYVGYRANPKQGGDWAYRLGFTWGSTPGDQRSAETLWNDGGNGLVAKSAKKLFLQGVVDGRSSLMTAPAPAPVPAPAPASVPAPVLPRRTSTEVSTRTERAPARAVDQGRTFTPFEWQALLERYDLLDRRLVNGRVPTTVSGSLAGWDLQNADLTDADLDGADLSGANLEGAELTRTSLIGANLTHAKLASANLTRAHLEGANLAGADLLYTNLHGADLRGANLAGAWLASANLTNANLTGAKLPGANLSSADLSEATLSSANLTGADLVGTKLTRANLTGAKLPGANLPGADLLYAKLRSTNLEGAYLYRANLYGADLIGANLTNADLDGANLEGANLIKANLTGASGLKPMPDRS